MQSVKSTICKVQVRLIVKFFNQFEACEGTELGARVHAGSFYFPVRSLTSARIFKKNEIELGDYFVQIQRVDPYGLIAFFGIMLLLAATPSGSVGFVVVSSATRGLSCGVAASLGIVAGDLIFVTLALLGLTALAEAMGALFAVLRYLGWSLFMFDSRSPPRSCRQKSCCFTNPWIYEVSSSALATLKYRNLWNDPCFTLRSV